MHLQKRSTTAFIFVIQGQLSSTNSQGTTTVLDEGAGVVVSLMSLATDDDGAAQFLFCGGIPNKEPLVSKGSFMMSNAECIAAADRNYREGAMGHIAPLDIAAVWKDGEL